MAIEAVGGDPAGNKELGYRFTLEFSKAMERLAAPLLLKQAWK
jgi:hypothetical protein